MRKALLNLNITIENDTTLEKNEDFNFTLQARDPMNRIQIVNESVAFILLNDDGEIIPTILHTRHMKQEPWGPLPLTFSE